MLITPHEIFYHSSDIIRTCILPIGQLSEEAWEVRNKHRRWFRNFRLIILESFPTYADLLTMLLIAWLYDKQLRNESLEKPNLLPLEFRNLLKVNDY